MVHARTFLVVALVAGLPICACSSAAPAENDAGAAGPTDGGATATATQVRFNERELFLSEAQWTRYYAMSAQAGGADKASALTRLSQSEDAIAASIATYAGEQSQAALAALLHERESAFVAYVSPMSSRVTNAQTILYVNARKIAQFYANLGGAFSAPAIESELDAQIHATLDGIDARGRNEDLAGVTAWEVSDQHTLALGDMIAAGIAKQYAALIAAPATTQTQDDIQIRMRVALDEHAFWLRAFLMDHWAQRNAQPTLDRVATADIAFGQIFSSYYGDPTGVQAGYFIHTDTTQAVAYVVALDMQSQEAVDGTTKIWQIGAEQFGSFLSLTNPNLNVLDMRHRLGANMERERAMITARFTQQWDAEVASYGQVVANWNAFADVVGSGVAATVVH